VLDISQEQLSTHAQDIYGQLKSAAAQSNPSKAA
jgi:hypothetical protein